MSLIETLRSDLFEAGKNKDDARAGILQIVIAAVKNVEIDLPRTDESRAEMTDDDVVKILRKEAKKVSDSLSQYTAAGRQDLADREKAQLDVLMSYLPALMSEEAIEKVVVVKINECGATSMKDMGKVIAAVKAELGDAADGATISTIVKSKLS